MAIAIRGNWNEGYAIDLYTLDSEYLGDDEQGNPKFNNTYSEIGNLTRELKYHSNISVIPDILAHMRNISFAETIDCIIPVPPSKYRRVQPVITLANEYGAAVGIEVIEGAISKKPTQELKQVDDPEEREEILRHSMGINQGIDLTGKNVLLIDDVYRSGATLRVITDILLEAGVKGVSVMTMTKTRVHR